MPLIQAYYYLCILRHRNEAISSYGLTNIIKDITLNVWYICVASDNRSFMHKNDKCSDSIWKNISKIIFMFPTIVNEQVYSYNQNTTT